MYFLAGDFSLYTGSNNLLYFKNCRDFCLFFQKELDAGSFKWMYDLWE